MRGSELRRGKKGLLTSEWELLPLLGSMVNGLGFGFTPQPLISGI